MCLHFCMQEGDIIGHSIGKCHLYKLQSICRPLCNIGMHLRTLLNIPTHVKILVTHMNAKCHKLTFKMKLIINFVTQHSSQNQVNYTITHVTLNTINDVLETTPLSHQGLQKDRESDTCNGTTQFLKGHKQPVHEKLQHWGDFYFSTMNIGICLEVKQVVSKWSQID